MRIINLLLIATLLIVGISCRAGQSQITYTPAADTSITGYRVFYSQDPNITNNLGAATMVDIGLTNPAVITGIPVGTNYFTMTAHTATGSGSPVPTVVGVIPNTGAVNIVLKP